MNKHTAFDLSAMTLRVLAMLCMLCDHLWGTIVPGNDWLTCVGRLAFPLYAFLLVQGYFHTKNLKNYALRLLMCAVVSEIPFNLVMGGSIFYPYHQNVLWSFLLCLGLMHWNETASHKVLAACGSIAVGCIVGLLTMVDYYHAGVLTVLVFYFFRKRSLWHFLSQVLCLWYIHTQVLGGQVYELGFVTLPQQGFALLALVPIWLYRGRRGPGGKALRVAYYLFYPMHLLVLGLLMRL